MSAFKTIGYNILSRDPLLRHWRRVGMSGKVAVLMYHEIAEDAADIEAWTVLKRSDFVRQMEYIAEHFSIVSLTEAIAARSSPHNGHADHSTKPMAVVTFDDGYAGNRTLMLPIIQTMGIPVTVFVASQAIQDQQLYWYDRVMNGIQGHPGTMLNLSRFSFGTYRINHSRGDENWLEIQRLLTDLKGIAPDERVTIAEYIQETLGRRGHGRAYQVRPLTVTELQELAACPLVTIGGHSHCHNLLTQLTPAEALASARTSKQLLESWIQRPVDYFAYPNGSYDDAVMEAVKAAGFSCGLTASGKPWDRQDSLFAIPRIGIGRYDSFEYFKLKVSGLLSALRDL